MTPRSLHVSSTAETGLEDAARVRRLDSRKTWVRFVQGEILRLVSFARPGRLGRPGRQPPTHGTVVRTEPYPLRERGEGSGRGRMVADESREGILGPTNGSRVALRGPPFGTLASGRLVGTTSF